MAYSKIVNDGKIIKELETVRISELISILMEYKKEFGDIPVYHQRDPEGNGFGTLNARSISWTDETTVGKAVFIYPWNEYIEDYLFEY